MRDTLVLDVTRSLCLQIRDQLDQSMPENKITIQQKLELIDKYKDVLSKDQKNELNIFLKNILKTYQNAKTIKTVKPLIESIIKSKNIYYPKARKIDDNQPPFLKYYISYTPRPVPELKNSTKPSCGDIRLFTPRARISQESTTSNYSFMQLLSLSFRKLLPSTNMTSESKKEMSIVYLKK